MNFSVGQEVICVKTDRENKEPSPCGGEAGKYLCKGQAYRIFDIREGYGEIFLKVNGVEGWWHRSRFKPAVKTDISIFTAMLKTDKVKA